MRFCYLIIAAVSLSALSMCGCSGAPEQPRPSDTPIVPREISDFNVLYVRNCAGCHGAEGRGGAAIPLNDPVYLAMADDAVVRGITSIGIRGTSMPAFAQSAGGMLTEKQIELIVTEIRKRWSKADLFDDGKPPSYLSDGLGDPARGSEVYAVYCSSCHGPGGRGGQKAGSIVEGSFLSLLHDQELRTIVIVGRPDLGAPDWRGNIPGKPMSPQDISDVVAWLSSQRPKFLGQPFRNTAKSIGEIR